MHVPGGGFLKLSTFRCSVLVNVSLVSNAPWHHLPLHPLAKDTTQHLILFYFCESYQAYNIFKYITRTFYNFLKSRRISNIRAVIFLLVRPRSRCRRGGPLIKFSVFDVWCVLLLTAHHWVALVSSLLFCYALKKWKIVRQFQQYVIIRGFLSMSS